LAEAASSTLAWGVKDYVLLSTMLPNQSVTDSGIMLRLDTSFRVSRHTWMFEGRELEISGMYTRICKVLMMPHICFIAIPRKAERKKFVAKALPMPLSIVLNVSLVLFDASTDFAKRSSYMTMNRTDWEDYGLRLCLLGLGKFHQSQ
jgi:hypothetical protein